MEKETMGTVISVTKQWWLKVNRKPARVHAMDGAAFPHTIKVKYTIDGKDYICRKWIGAGNKVPDKGTTESGNTMDAEYIGAFKRFDRIPKEIWSTRVCTFFAEGEDKLLVVIERDNDDKN